jgi:hypothetical protein
MTALCFLLIGVVIIASSKWKGSVSLFASFLVAVIAALRVLSTLEMVPFEIDLLLFGDAVLSSELPARMSQFTAISLMLLGSVPLTQFIPWFRRTRLPEFLATIVFLFALIALTGLTLDIRRLVTLPAFLTLSTNAAALLGVAGLTLYAIYRERDQKLLGLRNWFAVSVIIFVTSLLTIVLASAVDNMLVNESRVAFKSEVDRVVSSIEQRMDVYISTLQGAKGLLASSQDVSRDEWKIYVDNLDVQQNYPGIQGV